MSSDSTKCSINFAVCFFTRLLNSTASPTKGTGALWLCSLMPGFVFLPHSRTVLYEYGVVAVAFFYVNFLVHIMIMIKRIFSLVGVICNCFLPESLKISPVGHGPNSQSEDSEKRRLRNPFSCFSSISSHRQLPSSSPFPPPSPVKEGLPRCRCSSRKPSTASLRCR
jgi:hypothetical protein